MVAAPGVGRGGGGDYGGGRGVLSRDRSRSRRARSSGTARRPLPIRSSTARSTNVADPAIPVADDGWALIAAVADQALDDEAFAPQVGQAELSISALSADERRALAGELAAELAPGRNREG